MGRKAAEGKGMKPLNLNRFPCHAYTNAVVKQSLYTVLCVIKLLEIIITIKFLME